MMSRCVFGYGRIVGLVGMGMSVEFANCKIVFEIMGIRCRMAYSLALRIGL